MGGDEQEVNEREQREFNAYLEEIYTAALQDGRHNYKGARQRITSGLCIEAWREHLKQYTDYGLVDFLAYGWPINYTGGGGGGGPLSATPVNHTSAVQYGEHVQHYIETEIGHAALAFLHLGRGAYLYKTDLARGYRQLRVDPTDWHLLKFSYEGMYFMYICPPFGLRTSAMFMQRRAKAICYMHEQEGYISKPNLDDFGGAEATEGRASNALRKLQEIMRELGVREALHKVCEPAQRMVWLGLHYDTIEMTITIPAAKMGEIMCMLQSWEGRQRATRRSGRCRACWEHCSS